MDYNEIRERNKNVARYMGYEYYPFKEETRETESPGWWKKDCRSRSNPKSKIEGRDFLCRNSNELVYHWNWNWIMPVFLKIQVEGPAGGITGRTCFLGNIKRTLDQSEELSDKNLIKVLWEVCSEYIENSLNRKNNMGKLVSLYQYLGKPAGGQQGMEVYKAFKREYPKEEPPTRFVDTKAYKGSIRLYPSDFLDRFFGKK